MYVIPVQMLILGYVWFEGGWGQLAIKYIWAKQRKNSMLWSEVIVDRRSVLETGTFRPWCLRFVPCSDSSGSLLLWPLSWKALRESGSRTWMSRSIRLWAAAPQLDPEQRWSDFHAFEQQHILQLGFLICVCVLCFFFSLSGSLNAASFENVCVAYQMASNITKYAAITTLQNRPNSL